jgi:hypothetical protein
MAERSQLASPDLTGTALLRLGAAALLGHGADMATAHARSGDGTLVLVAAYGFQPPFTAHVAAVVGAGSACAAAMEHRAAVEIVDLADDDAHDSQSRELLLRAGSRACISSPVLDGDGAVIGVVSAHYRTAGHHDVAPVDTVAGEVGDLLAAWQRVAAGAAGGEPAGAHSTPAAAHADRRRAAFDRVVARHEQSAVLHEMAATLFDRGGRHDEADAERRLADEQSEAASRDRDRRDRL